MVQSRTDLGFPIIHSIRSNLACVIRVKIYRF